MFFTPVLYQLQPITPVSLHHACLATKAHEQACLARTGHSHARHVVVDGKKQRIPIALPLCGGELYPDLDVTSSATDHCDGTTSATPNSTATSASSSAAAATAASESTDSVGGKFPGNCFFKCEDFVNSPHGNVKKYDVIMW